MSYTTPVTLSGEIVRLEPLSVGHVPALAAAGRDPVIWEHMLYGVVDTHEKMLRFVQDLLQRQQRGTDLPFTVVLRASGQAIGCTRYLDIQPHNRSVEIGGTWYAPAYQRTGVNTEAKLLLLTYAFEQLQTVRVQFKTDVLNLRSQLAIERLGAVKEGVLRNHLVRPDGSLRSSVYYSILAQEWPGVRVRLTGFLTR